MLWIYWMYVQNMKFESQYFYMFIYCSAWLKRKNNLMRNNDFKNTMQYINNMVIVKSTYRLHACLLAI